MNGGDCLITILFYHHISLPTNQVTNNIPNKINYLDIISGAVFPNVQLLQRKISLRLPTTINKKQLKTPLRCKDESSGDFT